MLIRKMVQTDAVAYRELRLRALKNSPSAFGSSYEETIEYDLEFFRQGIPQPDSDSAIFVAEDQGQIIGMLGFLRSDRFKTKHGAMIWGVYVDVEARGKGIGRQLMAAVIDHAQQVEGLRRITLSVVTTNAVALTMYQSFGFTIWGTEPEVLSVAGTFYDEHNLVLRL